MDEATLRQLMIADEGEGLEFKKALLSRKETAEYAVGIGNEGGGWLVMGVTDRRPRRIVGIEEQSIADLQKLRDSVMDGLGQGSALEMRSKTTYRDASHGAATADRVCGRPLPRHLAGQ